MHSFLACLSEVHIIAYALPGVKQTPGKFEFIHSLIEFHRGWLLLKCSAIGIGFNGAETNCRNARILGILLMNGYNNLDIYRSYYCVRGLSP